ncbi:MAG: ABC transporter ATP-binding protein [Gammaproteobacteria bacterium]|nr:ABC transporter ATP-binding protein [Gammaproteobacteria bacterium]
MQSQLIVDNISIAYSQQIVIKNCCFSLQKGEILSLLGSSGCGKSTLLKAIAGLMPLHNGSIKINDTIISDKNHHAEPDQRGIGMIFQDYALFPHLTVTQNIEFGLIKLSKAERKVKSKKVIEIVKLEEFSHRYPHELSGGQQQRVAIARTLVCEPNIILFDEPFSNLDVTVRQELMKEIKELLRLHNITAIFVTHDKNEAFAMADKVAIMRDGGIVQIGNPQTLYDKPIDQDIANFLGSNSILPANKVTHGWETPIGIISNAQAEKVTILADEDNNSKVYLRPHQIALHKSSNGKASIMNHSFRGDLHVYTIALENENRAVQIITQQRFSKGDYIDFTLNLN